MPGREDRRGEGRGRWSLRGLGRSAWASLSYQFRHPIVLAVLALAVAVVIGGAVVLQVADPSGWWLLVYLLAVFASAFAVFSVGGGYRPVSRQEYEALLSTGWVHLSRTAIPAGEIVTLDPARCRLPSRMARCDAIRPPRRAMYYFTSGLDAAAISANGLDGTSTLLRVDWSEVERPPRNTVFVRRTGEVAVVAPVQARSLGPLRASTVRQASDDRHQEGGP